MERRTNNPLLVKAAIGRSKPITTKLPPDEFVYGKIFKDEDPFLVVKNKGVKWPRVGQKDQKTRNYSYGGS